MCNWGGQVLNPALIWEAKMYSCSVLLVGVNWNPVPSGAAVVKNRELKLQRSRVPFDPPTFVIMVKTK